jgi:hypothetical protein
MNMPEYIEFRDLRKFRKVIVCTSLITSSFICNSQNVNGMIDTSIRSYGEFIDYSILPEHKTVKLVSLKSKAEFENILTKYDAKKISVDFDQLKSDNDSNYAFSLARISLITINSLSNGLFAIDQFVIDKANPYYICESLKDFKLITKYLLIFRPEVDWKLEVECSTFEHFEIKKFLEREKEHLKLIKEMSDERYKLFMTEDGKCVYVSYSGNRQNENEFYWSLVIYESMEKLKLHNVDLR